MQKTIAQIRVHKRRLIHTWYELQNLRKFIRLKRRFAFWQRERVRRACSRLPFQKSSSIPFHTMSFERANSEIKKFYKDAGEGWLIKTLKS